MTDKEKKTQPATGRIPTGANPLSEQMLDVLLSGSAPDTPSPRVSADFADRMLSQALDIQDGFIARRIEPVQAGLWMQLREAVGGWPAFGAMGMAACAGIWIGVAPPELISEWPGLALSGLSGDFTAGVSTVDLSGFANGIDLFLEEG